MGAKFYKELNEVKHLCVHMDISNEEMRSQPVQYMSCLSYRVKNLVFFLRRGGGGGGGAYLNSGTYSKCGVLIWSRALI